MTNNNSTLRAEIIEKSINIEWLIKCIISQHYFEKVKLNFLSEVLYDEYCSFALKRRVLFKICPNLSKEFENQLNRLNTIRNYFAHVGQTIVNDPSPDSTSRIPDPRDFSKSVDFEKLHCEFVKLEPAVVSTLFKQYEGKGGQSMTAA